MKLIQSNDNKYIKLTKSLEKKKYRQKEKLFLDEGIKNISMAVKSSYEIKFVLIREDFDLNQIESFISKIDKEKIFLVKNKIFEQISDTVNSQGIIAVLELKSQKELDEDKILILDRIQDPGNAGTILRTAEACGIKQIYYTQGTVDFYSPKVVRASMGSIYFININQIENVSKLKEKGYKLYSSALYDSIDYKQAFTDNKLALIIGNEANGIDENILKISDKKIKIPIKGQAESLNAAIAAGILMYEMM